MGVQCWSERKQVLGRKEIQFQDSSETFSGRPLIGQKLSIEDSSSLVVYIHKLLNSVSIVRITEK